MRIERLLPFIGVALFMAVIARLNFTMLLSAAGRVDPVLVSISAACTIPALIIKARKWTLIVKSYGIRYPLLAASRAWLTGFFMGSITPGRIGDLYRAFYLRRDAGVSTGRSLTTVIIDRILDIGTLFFISIAGLLLIVTPAAGTAQVLLIVGAAFAAFAAAVLMAMSKGLMRAVLNPLFRRFAPAVYRQALRAVFHDFYSGVMQMDMRKLLLSSALSVACWVIVIMQYYVISLSIGLGLPVAFFFGVIPVVIILETLPVSFSGFGIREASLVFFFSVAGASAESAFLVSIILFVQGPLICLFLGLFFWARDPARPGLRKRR